MIGLLDYDALYARKIRYPNLELMKMATYLRRGNQAYQIVLNLDELERYQTIHLFQDNMKIPFPVDILKRKNVVWHGLAFSDGVRIPLAPEIEAIEPTIGVYKLLFRDFILQNRMKITQVGYLLNSSFMRLSEPISKKYLRSIRPNRRIFVYDIEVFKGCWRENTTALLARKATGFHIIHPQRTNDFDLWLTITEDYGRNVFARNHIELTFELTFDNVERASRVFQKLITEKTLRFSWLRMIPTLSIPHKESVLHVAQAIMIPAKYGLYFPWGELSFTGNPYHPILAALFKWASSKRFYEQSFVDYCELKTKYRERNYILKLVEKNKKWALLFLMPATGVKDLHGGMKEYDTRRNIPSIYETYL